MNFSKYITSVLDNHGYTRRTFSSKLNVSYSTLCAWIYGSRIPNAYQIIDLINVISEVTKTTPFYQQRRILKVLRDDKLDAGL